MLDESLGTIGKSVAEHRWGGLDGSEIPGLRYCVKKCEIVEGDMGLRWKGYCINGGTSAQVADVQLGC
jgi:hypothetical protein